MNKSSKHLLAVVALVISGSVCAQESAQPVKVIVDNLPPHVANQVKEKAKQGSTELRRFVNRTRMIHELDYGAIVREESLTAIANRDADARMAARATEPGK